MPGAATRAAEGWAVTDHAPDAETERHARRLDPLGSAAGLLLAVSGGADSTALMHVAAAWRRSAGRPPVTVASVDHGLRPEARDEADGVVAMARHLGFEAARLTWTGDKPPHGLAERARIARYDLLATEARTRGACHIVTAHTLDDQAETVLLRMARGSGLGGLGAMRATVPIHGLTLARPFLDVPKADLVALCRRQGWTFIEDPSNRDPTSTRVRWRRLAPRLSVEGLTPQRLATLARRLARADAALDEAARAAHDASVLDGAGPGRVYDMAALTARSEELIVRVLAQALIAVSGRERPKLERIERLAADLVEAARHGQASRRTLHHCLVRLDRRGELTIERESERLRGRRYTTPQPAAAASLGKGPPASYIAFVDAAARHPDVAETHCTSDAPARAVLLSAGPQ